MNEYRPYIMTESEIWQKIEQFFIENFDTEKKRSD